MSESERIGEKRNSGWKASEWSSAIVMTSAMQALRALRTNKFGLIIY